MKIGELAKATAFTDKTIRYYERQGLLPKPRRTASGYREYGPEDVDRLAFIRKAKRLGLSLEDIKGVLRVHDRSQPTCAHVWGLLEAKLAQVEAALRDLQAFRAELVELYRRAGASEDCRPAGGRICGIIENSAFSVTEEALEWLRGAQPSNR